jgi:hypothetical protein
MSVRRIIALIDQEVKPVVIERNEAVDRLRRRADTMAPAAAQRRLFDIDAAMLIDGVEFLLAHDHG